MNSEIFNNLSEMLKNSKSTYNSNNSGNFNNHFFNNFKDDIHNQTSSFDFSSIDMETLLKLKNIMSKINSNQPSPRNKLLESLKPYLKDSRKEKIDKYIQLINIATIFESLNNNSGGDIK